MSGRFWITGVQLGLVIEFSKAQRTALVSKITDEQYLGKTGNRFIEEITNERFRQNKRIREKRKEAKKK